MRLNFCVNYIKIKSSWFDRDGVIKKIGTEGFYLYLQLYRYYLSNQEKTYFKVDINSLKKDVGFSENKTMDLFKLLIRYKLISCSVTRWDRYSSKENILVEAIDLPQTHREMRGDNEVDVPDTQDDYYIALDMKILDEYSKIDLNPCCYSIYALINKYFDVDAKSNISINEMAARLGVSNDRVNKSIRSMNYHRFMYSHYRTVKTKSSKTPQQRFDHYLFNRFNDLERKRVVFEKRIQANVDKWNKT